MRRMGSITMAGLTALMVLLAGCSSGSGPVPPSISQDITAAQLESMMSDGEPLVIVDVRTAGEYQDGHIPGSVNIPLSELPTRLDELAVDVRTVCVCWSGLRSASGAQVLLDGGFTRVYNLRGGLQNWHGIWEPAAGPARRALLSGSMSGASHGPCSPEAGAVA